MTASEIERELEATRAEMGSTIEALADKLTPGSLMRWAADYFETGPKQFADNLGNDLRRNPVPALLAGIGIGWLMLAGRSRREGIGSPYGDRAREGMRSMREKVSGVGERMRSRKERANLTMAEQQQRYGHSAEGLRERTGETAERLRERASEWTESGRLWAVRASRAGSEAGDSARRMIDDRPLVVGLVALAAGALIGAAMPRVDSRSEKVERTRERLAEQAREKAAEATQGASEKVTEGMERAGEGLRTGTQEKEGESAGGTAAGPSSGGSKWH
jgi:hypothetical protein